MQARKPDRHSDLKNMLEARRAALLTGVRDGIRESSDKTSMPRQGDVLDTGDEGEAMLQDALRFAVISMKSEVAAQIEKALTRLAEGRYGACGDCGQEIADARLRAMPFAVRCKGCEQSHEDAERARGVGPRLMGRLRVERPGTAVRLEELTAAAFRASDTFSIATTPSQIRSARCSSLQTPARANDSRSPVNTIPA